MNTSKLIHGFATIDDSAEYPALCDPTDTWNGWAQPYFTRETFLRVCAEGGVTILEERDSMVEVDLGDGSPCDDLVSKELIDGTIYYFFDGWCWDFWPMDRVQALPTLETTLSHMDMESGIGFSAVPEQGADPLDHLLTIHLSSTVFITFSEVPLTGRESFNLLCRKLSTEIEPKRPNLELICKLIDTLRVD